MRVSQQLTTTVREAPHDADVGSQALLVRAGFVCQLTSGVYSFLPLVDAVQVIQEEIRTGLTRA